MESTCDDLIKVYLKTVILIWMQIILMSNSDSVVSSKVLNIHQTSSAAQHSNHSRTWTNFNFVV